MVVIIKHSISLVVVFIGIILSHYSIEVNTFKLTDEVLKNLFEIYENDAVREVSCCLKSADCAYLGHSV